MILSLCFILSALALIIIQAAYPVHTPDSPFVRGIANFLPAETPSVATKHLHVVTFNLGYGSGMFNNQGVIYDRDFIIKNLDAAAKILAKKKADVIAFQEIDFDSHRTFGINQLEYLAKKLNLAHGAYALNWSKRYLPFPYWPPRIHFGRMQSGLAILSRYPILSNEVTILEKPKSNPFWYNWFYLERTVQHAVVQVGTKKIDFFNLHLEAFDYDTRLAQAARLASLIPSENNNPVIVLGDFNDPEKITLEKKRKDAATAFAEIAKLSPVLPIGSVKTFSADKPFEHLDHIFVSKDFLVQGTDVPTLETSDHLPVWVELEMQ